MSAPYTMMGQVTAKIPPQFLLEALDDDGDGQADPGIFNQVVANAQTEIDGALGGRYPVPFDNPIPAVVANAALILTCLGIYDRRVSADKNPFTKQANDVRTQLGEIGDGTKPLVAGTNRVQPSATVITEPAKTSGRRTAT